MQWRIKSHGGPEAKILYVAPNPLASTDFSSSHILPWSPLVIIFQFSKIGGPPKPCGPETNVSLASPIIRHWA